MTASAPGSNLMKLGSTGEATMRLPASWVLVPAPQCSQLAWSDHMLDHKLEPHVRLGSEMIPECDRAAG